MTPLEAPGLGPPTEGLPGTFSERIGSHLTAAPEAVRPLKV